MQEPLSTAVLALVVSNMDEAHHSAIRPEWQVFGIEKIEAVMEAVSLGHIGWRLSAVVPETGQDKAP